MQLELGRRAVSPGDTVGCGEDLTREARERHRVDGPAVDLEPFPVADQVRLGRRAGADPRGAQGARGEGEHAALAVRAADQGAAQLPLRIAENLQERTCSSQPQPNPESTAIGERPNRRVIRRCLGGSINAGALDARA